MQIVPPPRIINGVPSNVLGTVGVGSWGAGERTGAGRLAR